MSKTLRFIAYIAAFTLPPIAVGIVRGKQYLSRYDHLPIAAPLAPALVPAAPAHDASKPTVAVLLGADVTEITDALGPYEIFSRAGRYNVYLVAPERRPSLLTGGLRILPHLSLSELDARLGGYAASVVVVPNIPNIKRPENQPLLLWMRGQAAAGALMHSWCAGALALAESGLLDGRRATAHWGDIGALERAYPRVTWVRGARWVEDETLVASAGINSGIDASLRVLTRRDGDSVARRVAADLRYPGFRHSQDPRVEQLEIRPADAVLFVNAAFRAMDRIGVALYDGVGELEISNVYDAHAASGVADVQAVAAREGIVRTKFGAMLLPTLVPTRNPAAVRGLRRVVVTGTEASSAREVTTAVAAVGPEIRVDRLDTDSGRYPLEAVLEDLAQSSDLPSARFAEKRLEYRSASIELEGSTVPWATLALPLAVGSVGVLLLWLLGRATTRVRSVAAAAALLAVAPAVGSAQSIGSLRANARVRIDVHTGERTLLRRERTQPLAGTLVAALGDTILLGVQPGAEPLRVPRTAVRELHISRGVPNRFESAARRAVLPTIASAAFTAASLTLRRRDGDPSAARGALSAAASAALMSGALGFINPRERWQRIRPF